MSLSKTRRRFYRNALLLSFALGLWYYDLSFLIQERRSFEQLDISNHRRKRRLPSFSNRGGVILFWHVVKTGGVTIRKSFYEFRKLSDKKIVVERSWGKTDYRKVAKQVDDFYLKQPNQDAVLLWELHGPDVPSIIDMQRDLKRWRSLSRKHDKAFFSFTLLREPVSLAVSYYNFFHVVPKRKIPYHQNADVRIKQQEAELVNITISNRQCTILSGRGGVTPNIQPPLPAKDERRSCQTTLEALYNGFDWVGVTSKLNKETLPLLTRMLFDNVSLADTLNSYNVLDSGHLLLKTSHLQPDTLHLIQNISNLDQEMLESVQRYYTMDMWESIGSG